MRHLVGLGATNFRCFNLQRHLQLYPIRLYQSKSAHPKPKFVETKTTNKGDGNAVPVADTVPVLPLWQRLGPLTNIGSSYARAQRHRPWATQFFSALVIYGLGDFVAQYISTDDVINFYRLCQSLIIGGVAAVPSYYWFAATSHRSA